ncbi:hypothetical protein EKD04_008165 [Chloroflexales bacterium ZM16-3]|nr:hypothetical protein [Chloroflexales bacterium ZM16-3]
MTIHRTLNTAIRARSIPSAIMLIALALALFSLFPMPTARAAGVIYVRPDGIGSGTSWPKAFPSLYDAMALAVSGDEIWVAAGTYTPGTLRTDTFQLKDGVAIYGGFAGTETLREQRDWAANVVTLSGDLNGDDGANFANNADNSYHVVTGATGAILDGVTISGGNNADVNSNSCVATRCGGGMLNKASSPTLSNVIFSGNSATLGGGMYNDSSSPTLANVTFSDNSASYDGGGMYNWNSSSPTLTNVIFSGNSASYGGGMANAGGNVSSPTLTNVTFSGNSASYGGGIANGVNSSPVLTNVIISGNSATNGGGGMYGFSSTCSPVLTNVTISGNSATNGGGIFSWYGSSPALSNVTISGNSATNGGGVYNENSSNPQIRNSIIWGNNGNAIVDNSSTPVVSYSIVEGGYVGTGNIDAAPLFMPGNLRLQAASPAINAGINTGVAATDLAGNPRIVGGTVDMGAYEVQAPSVISVARAGASPTNAASVDFTVTFNMPVSGVDASDFTLTTTGGQSGATISTVSGSGTTWTVPVNSMNSATGTIQLNLVDNDTIVTLDTVPVSLGGNEDGSFSDGAVYDVDRVAPSVVLSSTVLNPTSASPIPVTVTFSEDVSGFAIGDIVAGNATVRNFAGSGASYTFDLTPAANGPVTADIAAGVATDAAGNSNSAASQFSRVYNPVAPITRIYLPLVMVPTPPLSLPDLVVEQISTAGGQLSVTIANQGAAAATDAFWVDLLIDPTRAPAQVNDTWDALGTRGLAWGVRAPLAPGARITLTVGDAFYRADYSNPGGPISVGTVLYAHVDAANSTSTYGGVRESHERDGGPYNNILGPVTATTAASLTTLAGAAPAAPAADLPPR